MQPVVQLQVDTLLFTGIDVGGTKVAIRDNASEVLHRYATADYPNMYAILDEYFAAKGVRPAAIALAMAGPRDDESGAVTITNGTWPEFNPMEAEKRYPGTRFETVNDMIGTAAGALAEEGVELSSLKAGTPSLTGTKLVVAISTGIGAAAAVWDRHTARYVYLASEGGHIGIQPENDEESTYLKYLQARYQHVSAEIALSGNAGIDHLIDHMLEQYPNDQLAAAVKRARADSRPVGAVLLEFAEAGVGDVQTCSAKILNHLGSMLGSVIRDLTVAFKPTGGIYLTGSIALALGEYFASETGFLKRFIHEGATHDSWVKNIPIYLITDPHVAVKGALQLAHVETL